MGHYFINDDNLKSEIKEFSINIENNIFKFKTDNGVFSKGELDYGTRVLIETILKENISGKLLDLGCGYGPIGIIISKIKNIDVDMVDVNKRAVHLTNLNIKDNNLSNINCFVSNGFENIENKYNIIVSNPPIRIGKSNLYKLIIDAKDYLLNDGKIFVVIRKEQGAKSFINDMSKYYDIDVLEKKKGFFVICLKCY